MGFRAVRHQPLNEPRSEVYPGETGKMQHQWRTSMALFRVAAIDTLRARDDDETRSPGAKKGPHNEAIKQTSIICGNGRNDGSKLFQMMIVA